MPHLKITTPGVAPLTIPLDAEDSLIGRSRDCHIQVQDPSISRIHARLILRPHGAVLEDLGSRGGTRLNGLPILRPLPLVHGDRIGIGSTDIAFLEGLPPSPPQESLRAPGNPVRANQHALPCTSEGASHAASVQSSHKQTAPSQDDAPPSMFSSFPPITKEELRSDHDGHPSELQPPIIAPGTLLPSHMPAHDSNSPSPPANDQGSRRPAKSALPADVLRRRSWNRRLAKLIIYGGLIIPFLIADVIIVHLWLKNRRAQSLLADTPAQRPTSSYQFIPPTRGSSAPPFRQAPASSIGSPPLPLGHDNDADTAWPFDNEIAQQRQHRAAVAWRIPRQKRLLLPGNIVMDFALIPPGAFLTGHRATEPTRHAGNREDMETPGHCRITRPYYMAIHECTQAQWLAVIGGDPYSIVEGELPVEGVGWNMLHDEFLPAIRRLAPENMRILLPTEAQWEYAARAGSAQAFYQIDERTTLDDIAWHHGNSHEVRHPVGRKAPNIWGLYDMHGNVWEWCRAPSPQDSCNGLPTGDPIERGAAAYRVLRGGSYMNHPPALSAAHRHHLRADSVSGVDLEGIGFRLVLEFERPPNQ